MNENKKPPMSDHQFYASMTTIILGALSLWIYKHESYLMQVYYSNFHTIYFSIAGVVALIGTYCAYKYTTRHKDMFERYFHLKSLEDTSFGRIFIGRTEDKMPITIADDTRTGHVQIIGATGRGKTESVIIPWAIRDLERQRSVVVIDGKGDPELARRIVQYAGSSVFPENSYVFNLASVETSCTINPLGFGSPQQIVDRLFKSFVFEDAYFKQVQFEICAHIVKLLYERGPDRVTYRGIYDCLADDNHLKTQMANIRPELMTPLLKWLGESRDKRDEKTSGLRAQLSPFATGEISVLVNGRVDGKEYFCLSEQLTRLNQSAAKLMVFLLPTLLYQEVAVALGKMLMQELGFSVSLREQAGLKDFTSVFMDEFSAFVYPDFVQILNKARSSGLALHLSHQSIGDLKSVSPSFATTVNTNTNVKCILGVNDPETADFYAKHLGTNTTAKMTEQVFQEEGDYEIKKSGKKSLREVESYKIHPNHLKGYTRGMGAIHFIENKNHYTETIQFEAL